MEELPSSVCVAKHFYNTPLAQIKQKRQYTYESNSSRNYCCSGIATNIAYSQCVCVACVNQHAKRMRPIILLPVARLTLPYFFTLTHKRHDFRKKWY
jgi:hypothetical protein